MSKFDFMNGLELKKAPPKFMTLDDLISMTRKAHGTVSLNAMYQGKERAIVPNCSFDEEPDGTPILAMKARGAGFVLNMRDLRNKAATYQDIDKVLISIEWHGDGKLYVSGLDLNDHPFPGIYMVLQEKL